jgi:hypothetical protein
VPAAQRDRQHPTCYDATSNTIHQNDGKLHHQLHVLHADRRTIQADLENPPPSTRITGCPINLTTIQNNIFFAQFTARNARATTNPPGTCHHHQSGELPTWQADLLRHANIKEEHLHLLESSPSIAVTDGGMEGGKGCFGAIIAVGKSTDTAHSKSTDVPIAKPCSRKMPTSSDARILTEFPKGITSSPPP